MRVLIFAVAFALVSVIGVQAYEVNSADAVKMQQVVYGSTIDSKVAFYQKRVYLVDSEFAILADIGKDAVKNIAYLKSHRTALIEKMIQDKVEMTQPALAAYLGKDMVSAAPVMEAYSK